MSEMSENPEISEALKSATETKTTTVTDAEIEDDFIYLEEITYVLLLSVCNSPSNDFACRIVNHLANKKIQVSYQRTKTRTSQTTVRWRMQDNVTQDNTFVNQIIVFVTDTPLPLTYLSNLMKKEIDAAVKEEETEETKGQCIVGFEIFEKGHNHRFFHDPKYQCTKLV